MKIDSFSKLTELKKKEAEYQRKLVEMRLKIGEADSAMQSQFPSGRFELEQEIQGLEIFLSEISKEIKELES
jgi:hypothetical protein